METVRKVEIEIFRLNGLRYDGLIGSVKAYSLYISLLRTIISLQYGKPFILTFQIMLFATQVNNNTRLCDFYHVMIN